MPSSRLSGFLHVLISHASKRRRVRQLELARNIVDDSHEIELRELSYMYLFTLSETRGILYCHVEKCTKMYNTRAHLLQTDIFSAFTASVIVN